MGLTKKAPKKRVLFFTDRVFWPANDGHKVVLFNYCKGLADKFDAEVHVLTFLEPGQTAQALSVCPEFIESVTLAKKPARQTVILNLIRALLKGAAGGPIQCSIFRSKGVANQLRDLVGELEPTHVFLTCRGSRLTLTRCESIHVGRSFTWRIRSRSDTSANLRVSIPLKRPVASPVSIRLV